MRMITAAAALGFALLPFAASAADEAPPVKTVSAVQQTDPVVCEYFYYQSTLIRKPTCLTAHQWERRRYAEQRYIREFQERSNLQH